jgi:hypothetical protein
MNDLTSLIEEVFPGILEPKKKYEYHCDLCMCPIDAWKPYRDYQSDRSCEMIYFLGALMDGWKGKPFTVAGFLEEHGAEIKIEFSDLMNLEGVLKQEIEWQIEIGDVTEISKGVYVAAPWPERKEQGK